MTNWDFYKDSYQLAAKAYEVYCDGNMRRRAVMCDDSTMCEICHARWYTLEWRPEEYMEVMAKVADDWGVKDWTEIKFEPTADQKKGLRTFMAKLLKNELNSQIRTGLTRMRRIWRQSGLKRLNDPGCGIIRIWTGP